MYLRNGLIVLSALMIGFCLSLYFQSENTSTSFSWDEYKDLSYQDERSHSLAEFNAKTQPFRLEEVLRDIVEKNRLAGEKTRVMEIGTGNGRVLMELRRLFPEIELYGINKEKTHTFYRRESFGLTALKFEILTKEELENTDLPYILFEDLDFGGRIPYGGAKFDMIFSQDTIKHIKYKFELWNEIMRVLRPQGISIHTDVTGLYIYDDGLVMEIKDAFYEMKKKGLDISALERPETVIFRKTSADHLIFPVTPHQPIPEGHIPEELRRPTMGYNLK
jgi:SAM-dependent methyltransferase